MANPLSIPCPAGCDTMLVRTDAEAHSDLGPRFEIYKCPDEACGRKVAVIYEPATGSTEDQKSWVEREVARYGAFFPSDYVGRFGRRNW